MLARSAEPELFQIVFAGVAGWLSVKPISGTGQWRLRDTLPGKVAMSMCGILLGLISALMSIEYHLCARLDCVCAGLRHRELPGCS